MYTEIQKPEILVQLNRIIIELNLNYKRLNFNSEPLNRKIAFDVYSELIDLTYNYQDNEIPEEALIKRLQKIQFTLKIIGSQLPILDDLLRKLYANT